MKNNTTYPKEYMEILNSYNDKNHRVFQLVLDLVDKGSRVLSIGCSPRELRLLTERKCNVLGIEVNQQIYNECIKIGNCLNINALDYKNYNAFDFITCIWNVIDYMDADERNCFLDLCYKNLKPKGKLIMTTTHKVLRRNYLTYKQIVKMMDKTQFKYDIFEINHEYLIVAEK